MVTSIIDVSLSSTLMSRVTLFSIPTLALEPFEATLAVPPVTPAPHLGRCGNASSITSFHEGAALLRTTSVVLKLQWPSCPSAIRPTSTYGSLWLVQSSRFRPVAATCR